MIKSKLIKAVMLGLCMSAFTSNVAFAQMSTTSIAEPVKGGAVSEEQNALYAKQKEIDQYLFVDHSDEIAKKGFSVYSTGVIGDVIEIAIVPYNKENADYLYEIFGNDVINVVEGDISIIYSSGIAESGVGYAEPGVVVGTAIDGSTTTLPDGAVSLGADPSEPVTGAPDAAAGDGAAGIVSPTDDAISDDGKIQIQIESASGEVNSSNPDVLMDSSAASQNGTDIRTVSAAENTNSLPGNADTESNAASTSLIVLAIAGGAIIIGGAIMFSNRKKIVKK